MSDSSGSSNTVIFAVAAVLGAGILVIAISPLGPVGLGTQDTVQWHDGNTADVIVENTADVEKNVSIVVENELGLEFINQTYVLPPQRYLSKHEIKLRDGMEDLAYEVTVSVDGDVRRNFTHVPNNPSEDFTTDCSARDIQVTVTQDRLIIRRPC